MNIDSNIFQSPEEMEQWLRDNRDCNCPWLYYQIGVSHGEHAQHNKSYPLGYKDGWRDGRLPLNNPFAEKYARELP